MKTSETRIVKEIKNALTEGDQIESILNLNAEMQEEIILDIVEENAKGENLTDDNKKEVVAHILKFIDTHISTPDNNEDGCPELDRIIQDARSKIEAHNLST